MGVEEDGGCVEGSWESRTDDEGAVRGRGPKAGLQCTSEHDGDNVDCQNEV